MASDWGKVSAARESELLGPDLHLVITSDSVPLHMYCLATIVAGDISVANKVPTASYFANGFQFRLRKSPRDAPYALAVLRARYIASFPAKTSLTTSTLRHYLAITH